MATAGEGRRAHDAGVRAAELTQGIFGSADPEFLGDATDPAARLLDSAARFAAYFDDLTADRQAHPRDDLATGDRQRSGRRLPDGRTSIASGTSSSSPRPDTTPRRTPEVGGVAVPQGGRVLLSYPSANRVKHLPVSYRFR